MKCIHCGNDAKYKDRTLGRCPSCGKPFAFEPKSGDAWTDTAFQSAIDAVSSQGKVRFGLQSLRYELARRAARHAQKMRGCLVPLGVIFVVLCVIGTVTRAPQVAIGLVVLAMLAAGLARKPDLSVSLGPKFDAQWRKWLVAHGEPPMLILRPEKKETPRELEADVADYSFDRAVICDRASTVDLLLANNFHFENNCAVLSIGGYPEQAFDTVLTMLKNNPKLVVFALHDCTPVGCRMSMRLATEEKWFAKCGTVVDIGLRPRHVAGIAGLAQPTGERVESGSGIDAAEADWLSRNRVELAAIRPEQVIKRLFRAMSHPPALALAAGAAALERAQHPPEPPRQVGGHDWSIDLGNGGGGDGGPSHVSDFFTDSDSFSSDADASDGGGDSFG